MMQTRARDRHFEDRGTRRGSASAPGRWLWFAAVVCAVNGALLAAAVSLATAAPYRPAGDETIVERLPSSGSEVSEELSRLRAELKADPKDLAAAAALARHYIARNRAEADPRTLGYAQAALAPWWATADAPASVLVLRANLRQRLHDFEGALRDLDRLLARQPRHGQALLSKAFVLQAMGRAKGAEAICQRLPLPAKSLVSASCLARMESLTGRAASAERRLQEALTLAPEAEPSLRVWALTNFAEIAQRRGDSAAAERRFKAALALGRRDAYLLDAYADLLLDQGRHDAVRALYEDAVPSDGHLLRRALAAQQGKGDDLSQLIAALRARFEASRRRGDSLHLREEARFELILGGNPEGAIALALENWQRQREPWDLRLLLAAAIAANRPAAATDALAWRETTGLEDPMIDRLTERLKGAAS